MSWAQGLSASEAPPLLGHASASRREREASVSLSASVAQLPPHIAVQEKFADEEDDKSLPTAEIPDEREEARAGPQSRRPLSEDHRACLFLTVPPRLSPAKPPPTFIPPDDRNEPLSSLPFAPPLPRPRTSSSPRPPPSRSASPSSSRRRPPSRTRRRRLPRRGSRHETPSSRPRRLRRSSSSSSSTPGRRRALSSRRISPSRPPLRSSARASRLAGAWRR